jgi:hypothetical protein
MSAYLQLGHESWSLLEEPDVGKFAGLVLSPVNDAPGYVADRLGRLGDKRSQFEVILDPQMYNPSADKGCLNEWSYYSAEFETADHSDAAWWTQRGREIVDQASRLGVNAICSPALFPRVLSDEYYSLMVEVGDSTREYSASNGVDTLLTAIVSLRDLANPVRAFELASLFSRSECDRLYLTFLNDDGAQREPLRDSAGIPTAVHLVRLLSSQMRVHVAFAAHDLVLWKYAGATDISSGKWQNVRRFSPGRWREEEPGGRQVPYWNESKLLTLLREPDAARLDREGWYAGSSFEDNPAEGRILEILRSGRATPWLKLSWLQYLRWVCNVESAWNGNPAAAEAALEDADARWGEVQVKRILFQERLNTGDHVREGLNKSLKWSHLIGCFDVGRFSGSEGA